MCLAIGGKIIVDEMPHLSYRQHGKNVMGLRRDFVSKLRKVRQYIFEQDVERQIAELMKGYQISIVNDYRPVIEDIMTYRKSIKSRMRLFNPNQFDFKDAGVQMTYYLKILLNKL